ncbi:hypothetical protein NEMBOFW57_005558 [Staphylotrichum longicolle]|uniref:Uncharacterized protein n=1 Tax=Staphylotrichum longicolle TaxID=669026 RepID=A0AAD4EXJ4_9PEZI|nr:hypothetical protein NEMBOFW57_005558 [Staphylotrichum longicolle]
MPPPAAAQQPAVTTDLPTAGGQGGILAVLIVVCLALFAAVLLGDWRSRHLVCPQKCRSRQHRQQQRRRRRPRRFGRMPRLRGSLSLPLSGEGGEEEGEGPEGETTPLLLSSVVPVPSPPLSSLWSSSSTLVDFDDSDSSSGLWSSSGWSGSTAVVEDEDRAMLDDGTLGEDRVD